MKSLKAIEAELLEVKYTREMQEKRYDSRLAALSEFNLIKLQTLRRTRQLVRSRQAGLEEKSKNILKDIADCQAKLRGPFLPQEKLEKAQTTYRMKVEQMYPQWQEQIERDTIRRLKRLEKTQESIARRRELAAQAFDKEKTLRGLVAEKEHVIQLLREQERKDLKQRELERLRLEALAVERAKEKFHRNQPHDILEPLSKPPSHEERLPELPPKPRSPQSPSSFTAMKFQHHDSESKQSPKPNIQDRVPPLPPKPSSPSNSPAKSPGLLFVETKRQASSPPSPKETKFAEAVVDEKRQEMEDDEVELTYEWKVVSKKAFLPPQSEQKLTNSEPFQRLARIPFRWNLKITCGQRDTFVPVTKALSMQEVLDRFQDAVSVEDAHQTSDCYSLFCDGELVDLELTVEGYGQRLFCGIVTAEMVARKSEPLRLHSDAQNWERVLRGIQVLVRLIESPDSYREVRGSKYGSLGEEYDFRELNSVVQQGLDGRLRPHLAVDLACQALKLLIKQEAAGLLPLALFSENGSFSRRVLSGQELSTAEIEGDLQNQFSRFQDARGQVWSALMKHWRWLVQEKLLSRDELLSVFVDALLTPGDNDDGSMAQTIKYVLRALTSTNVSLEDSSRNPRYHWTDSAVSYDALLGEAKGPSPARFNKREQADQHLIDDSESEEDTEPPHHHVPRKALQSFDDFEEDEEEDDADTPSHRGLGGSASGGSLAHFLAANKTAAPSELEHEDIDDEFDF